MASGHVLLSRAEDTRWTFSDHLYTALVGAGFRTFTADDDQDGHRCDVRNTRSCIIIFSKNYVFSELCLDELWMVLDYKNTINSRLLVLPVFYDLDPSQVRKQSGIVAEALEEHEARIMEDEDHERERRERLDKMEKWRAALRQVADLAGLVLHNQADGHEAKFIKIIVQEIANKLDRVILSVTPYPTGIDSRVIDINNWLRDESNKVGILVIYGMGGIGKTTLAKIAYNQNFERFDGSSFVANVREASKQPNGLVRIQKQIVSNIGKRRKERINNVDEGIIKIKDAMCCKRVLVVLDDVDELDQLNAIFSMRDWFYPGSKIIVTTRQEKILKANERFEKYKVKELNDGEALCLFSKHAFRQEHPVEAYKEHSRKAVQYCGGLPLALEVLGSTLASESVDVWESALAKLGTFPNVKIQNVLQISFDCLDGHDKELFLDIVCFFVGREKDFVVKILDGCDFHTIAGLRNLARRCLVETEQADHNIVMMHQLVRDMGREIIHQESPKDPGRRSRVWHHNDAFDVLKEKSGTAAVEGLVLDSDARKEDEIAKNVKDPKLRHIEILLRKRRPSKKNRLGLLSWLPASLDSIETSAESEVYDFETDAFSRMQNLRILQLQDIKIKGNCYKFPKKLRWLCWRGFPLTFMPTDFALENMVVLDFPYSKLKQFSSGTKVLKQLKILNLTRSYDLMTSPNFSNLPYLERLILKDCICLVEIHESIVELKRLALLNLKGCKNLRKLPSKICQLDSLEELILSGCSKLEELPTDLSKMESLKGFQADGVNLLHSTSGEVKPLQAVIKSWVSKPSKRPGISLPSLPNFIAFLSLADCNITDNTFPKDLNGMPLLQGLRLSRNPIRNLPSSIRNLDMLIEIDLERCTKLQTLPELPMSLRAMSIYGCRSLKRAKNLPNLLSSLMLSSYGCEKLDQVQGLFKLEPIEKFNPEMAKILGLAPECMGRLEMKLFSNLTYTTRKVQEPQGLYECGIYSIFLPGSAVPDWFSNKIMESSISFNVPTLANSGTWGLKVCVCYTLALYTEKRDEWRYEYIEVRNKTKGLNWIYRPTFIGSAENGKDIVWLSDWKIGNQIVESGDEVIVSVNMDDCYQVKELGTRVWFDDQERGEGWSNEYGYDLETYRMSGGEYFLCNHEEYARSQHYSKMTGLSSIETCLCGFQCAVHNSH